MGLTARIVAKPLISTALSAFGVRTCQGDEASAMLAAGEITSRRHQPVHLKIHGSQQTLEIPVGCNVRIVVGPFLYLEGRIDKAHRRYLTSIKALAQIRKMGPAVQINIAEKQINQAG
jgi:hypothetical protein